jgi:programmed cell death 6-interacting protein
MVEPLLPTEISSSPQNPLLRSLVPYAIRQAILIYNERKNTAINCQMVPEWEEITAQNHALLRELGLPGSLQVMEISPGLPPSLLTHMGEVKTQGGISKLKQMRADVRNLCSSDKDLYQQVISMAV